MKIYAALAWLVAAMPAMAGGAALDVYVGGRTVRQAAVAAAPAESATWLERLFAMPSPSPVPSVGADAYTYAWPGVYFEANFTGDEVDVKVDDDRNALYLFVDGGHKLTLTKPGKTTMALKNLGAGRHTVRLEKISETQSSTGTFDGFFVPSADQALPAPRYAKAIEFIGDSYTVGYGNASRGRNCTAADVAETTDTSRAFAPKVAKHFGAAYRIAANSGHGIVRNYANFDPGKTLPWLYGYALFDGASPADDGGWKPDAIVIYLGTNDFSTPLGATEPWATREDLRADFVKTYAAFVRRLHESQPQAHFLLLATVTAEGELSDAVNRVAEGLKAGGFADFEIVPVGGIEFSACHAHPSLKDEGVLAQLVIDRLAKLPGFAAAEAK